jgi:hypothetical protein
MFTDSPMKKRDAQDKVLKTNCYVCGDELTLDEAKKNPENEGDTRIYCIKHWKKRYGKKKRLLKRY